MNENVALGFFVADKVCMLYFLSIWMALHGEKFQLNEFYHQANTGDIPLAYRE